MNVEKFTGPGSTPSRRVFWDSVADAVTSLTKQEGKDVSVQEFPGQGTIVNVDRKSGTIEPIPICPPPNPCTFDVSYSSPHYTLSRTGVFLTQKGSCDFLGSQSGGLPGLFVMQDKTLAGSGGCDTCIAYGDDNNACKCELKLSWQDLSDTGPDCTASDLEIVITKYVGDTILSPDGWYLFVNSSENTSCATSCSFGIDNDTGLAYLGADDSIFDTDFNVSLTLTGFGFCDGETADFDLTFHPCPIEEAQDIICVRNFGVVQTYSIGDVLSFTDGTDSASVELTAVVNGTSGGTGRILAFEVLSNTFTSTTGDLPSTGGTGSGATFRNIHLDV